MKKMIIGIALASIVGACVAYVPLAPSQSDMEWATRKFPGITLEELNNGKALFEQKCKKCHSLARPFRVSEADLLHVMPKMAKKAKIDVKTSDQILKYLEVMRSAPKKG